MDTYVVFNLANEQYGISISRVREIVQWSKVTKLPQTSEIICGVQNLRGEIVPIISLRTQFGLPQLPDNEGTKIIVVEVENSLYGVVVDSVDEVKAIAGSMIQSVPEGIPSSVTDFVKGIAQFKDRLIILIDAEKMFTDEEKELIKGEITD